MSVEFCTIQILYLAIQNLGGHYKLLTGIPTHLQVRGTGVCLGALSPTPCRISSDLSLKFLRKISGPNDRRRKGNLDIPLPSVSRFSLLQRV